MRRKCEESLIFVPQWCKLILSCFQKVAADKRERRVIEAVITSCTRNAVVLTGTWVRIPHSPPQKVGNFDRNCLPFLFARKPLISGLFRYPAIKKLPLRSHFRSGIFAFSSVPGTPLPDKSFSQWGIVQIELLKQSSLQLSRSVVERFP